jgi:hypothetical protein
MHLFCLVEGRNEVAINELRLQGNSKIWTFAHITSNLGGMMCEHLYV